MKKNRKAARKSLPVVWVDEENFDLDFQSVQDVYARCPNIIVLPFASKETAFFQPPPPMAA